MFRERYRMNNVLLKMQTAKTENSALSYATTGSACLDYWSKCSTYQGRSQSDVDRDMAKIFAEDEKSALKIVFGMRMITRKPNVDDEEIAEEVATGYGRRDEFYKAIVWLHNNKPELLYQNLHLIPVFGSWKDFFNTPLIDVLDRKSVFAEVRASLFGVKDTEMVKKFLPQIRSVKNLRSERDKKRVAWAKEFCEYCKLSPKTYRKLKSSGEAHIWQKQMTRNEWDKINPNGIPGKAMFLHTARKGKDGKTVFERHDQVGKILQWVQQQKTVKFTGYPYELLQAAQKGYNLVQRLTYDKQFETLLEPMKNHKLGNVLACLDTSGSMMKDVAQYDDYLAPKAGVTAYEVCVSMGLVFSSLNVGDFKDSVVEFNDTSRLVRLSGSFTEKLQQIKTKVNVPRGGTNFQSVIDLLVRIRKENPNIPVSEYPETILIVSDMQFNPVNGNTQTNYEAAMQKLHSVGLNDMRIIWWWVTGRGKDFPSQMNDKGVYMIGGFDASNIKSLMGLSSNPTSKDHNFNAKEKVEQTPMDGMNNWLSQPIFELLKA